MSVFSGKCLCGNVSYQCHSEPKAIFNCHCEDCRRATGSVFGTNLFVPETKVKISGKVSSYSHISDSGSTMTKRFCPNCGSLLFGSNSAKPNVVSIRAGTVDQLALIKPQINLFMDKKVPSTSIDENLKQASRMP
ncbi:GFA family protein [Planktomarina sp.]|nr:GFA family protein [Planktomarina sp.]MDA9100201.1 GFA family protein [Planktomarina sp.]MDB4051704.1 GFA family protein [Planktomarina sp.]